MISIKRLKYWEQKLTHLQKKHQTRLQKNMSLRLATGLIGLGLILPIALVSSPLLIALWTIDVIYFIYLVCAYKNLKRFIRRLQFLQGFFSRQKLRAQGLFSNPKPFSPSLEGELGILSQDFHLFGEKSLFEFINESFTPYGKKIFLQWFKQLEQPHLPSIKDRQNKWAQWRPFLWRFISLKVMGGEHRLSSHPLDLDRSLVSSQFFRHFKIQLLAWITMWTLVTFSFSHLLPFSPAWPIICYLFFILTFRSETQASFSRTQDLAQQIQSLVPLLKHIETHFKDTTFTSHFKNLHRFQFSRKSKNLQFLISLLSVQAHPMAHIAVNLLIPWESLVTLFVEKWRVRSAKDLPLILEEIGEFEALMSLSLMSHFQTSHCPHLSSNVTLKVKEVYHPLIPKNQVIKNDFDLKTPLILLTGSNMAGKSTFLRTLGINHILTLLGAPVYATHFQSFCAPIFSCLRVNDSLEDGYSKFYYEVERISQILKSAQAQKTFLYFIDEIFNGTNNRERLKGSQTVIKEIIKFPHVIGFISSHDLELSKMEKNFPKMGNWHFRDDTQGNHLTFNYQIQPGPCPTTNALKIMSQAGIPVEQEK